MADRYAQLVDLVRRIAPATIVEVGVHRAARARLLCREALALSRRVHYVGFDVFETMDPAFHDAAMNGKGIPAEAQARSALDDLKRQHPGYTYELRVGDTRQTLHGQRFGVDLAWIDGDHRVEAILGDYLALRDSRVIALDDYIESGPNGEGPDLTQYGANEVVRRIVESGEARSITLLPARDLCRHGGYARIAVVER